MSRGPVSNLVEFRGLGVDFRTPRGRVHALRDVTFDVPRGKILGIVGESGSGKSTAIWALLRLLAPNALVTGGEIRFDGRDVLGLGQHELRSFRGEQVSVVFQDPMTAQIPVLSYRRQMADILYRRGTGAAGKHRRAVEMMRRVGIPDPEIRLGQYPHQFSGGMRQRAGIAMALLMEPALLVADEPTTALDVTMEAQIIHLMRRLQAEMQATLVVVSHNLGLIAELCDEVVVLYAGEVVEKGAIRQIFHDARHPYTRALLECDPARILERAHRLPTIPGELPDLRALPQGCVFAPRCPKVMPVCHRTEPLHHAAGEGHRAKCHLLHPGHADPGWPPHLDDNVFPAESRATTVGSAQHGEQVLEVRDLHVRFRTGSRLGAVLRPGGAPHVDAVLGASLTLARGETLGIVGESGSGKTTLARAILGLAPAWGGSVRIEGREVLDLGQAAWRQVRRQAAMMFQDPIGSLSPRQTVRSILTEPFVIHGIETDLDEAAVRLCEMVRFPVDFLSRYPHELSGGQARRVGVARALALQPRLILADEPTAGLDVSVQGEILNLMADLQREMGLAFLLISHNLPVVRHISQRLAIMYLGRIVETGASDAVFARPAHPYTEALVLGVPRPDPDHRRDLVSIEGEVPSLARRPPGCEFHTRCPYAEARCRHEAPAPRQLADGRTVRCHFPRGGAALPPDR